MRQMSILGQLIWYNFSGDKPYKFMFLLVHWYFPPDNKCFYHEFITCNKQQRTDQSIPRRQPVIFIPPFPALLSLLSICYCHQSLYDTCIYCLEMEISIYLSIYLSIPNLSYILIIDTRINRVRCGFVSLRAQ